MKKELLSLFFAVIFFTSTNITFAEKNDISSEIKIIKEEEFTQLAVTDKFFITVSIITPEIIRYRFHNSNLEPEKREEKINEEINSLELDKGICVMIRILNKNWMTYNPNISGITDRIYMEDDKGITYIPRKILRNIKDSNLKESEMLVLSFPKDIVKSINSNLFIIIRGIDKNAINEQQIKINFPKNLFLDK